MAHYEHLPLYNKAFSILREFHIRVPKFAKQYKYSLGGRLLDLSTKIIELIIRANGERENEQRAEMIERLCLHIEILIIQLRIANELKQLGGQRPYLYLSELVIDLSKQAEGWRKYTPQNAKAESLGSEG